MEPNNFFSPARFGRFMSAYLQLNYKTYLSFPIITFISMYLLQLLFLNNYINRQISVTNIDYYMPTFYIGLLQLGAFIGLAFPELSDKIKTGNYLLLPASTFEKLLSQFLVYIVAGSLLFIIFFGVGAHLARWTMLHTEEVISGKMSIDAFSYSAFWRKTNVFLNAAPIGIGFFLFAVRLYFRKYALAKTIVALIAFWFLCMGVFWLASFVFFHTSESSYMGIPVYKTEIILSNIIVWYVFLSLLASIVALPLAYYKLKEKDV